jgi:hypothetical protein
MPWLGWVLMIVAVVVGLIVLIVAIVRFMVIANEKAKASGDLQEKEVLDRIQSALTEELAKDPSLKDRKAKIYRRDDHYLQILQDEYDEKTVHSTPVLLIQFNQEFKRIDFRLYVKEFYRAGNFSNELILVETYKLDRFASAVEHAFPIWLGGFEGI